MSEDGKQPSAVDIFNRGLSEPWVYDPAKPNGFEVPGHGFYGGLPEDLAARIASEHNAFVRLGQSELRRKPIPMILHCPVCSGRHVDAPEPGSGWENPPHKSHLCHSCKTVWRPADVPTVGVEKIETRGEKDTWSPPKRPLL